MNFSRLPALAAWSKWDQMSFSYFTIKRVREEHGWAPSGYTRRKAKIRRAWNMHWPPYKNLPNDLEGICAILSDQESTWS